MSVSFSPLDLVNDLVQALCTCIGAGLCMCACIHLCLRYVRKQERHMYTACVFAQVSVYKHIIPFSVRIRAYTVYNLFFSHSDVSKDKALHFQWYYASTESRYGRNRGKEPSSTLWLFSAVDSMFTWGRNQMKQLWWQKCWGFDLLLRNRVWISMHARQ